MKLSSVFLMAVALVLYLALPAFAQRGGGFGAGAGRGFGGMSSGSGEEWRRHSGGDKGFRTDHSPKEDALKSDTGTTGKKTVNELLTQDTKLSSNVQGLLPTGTNLQDAAKGFGHLGEFVAAVHVSHNLGIPFDQLKTKMMNGDSLGQAIHELRPNANAREEAIKANEQALQDMEKSMASKNAAAAAVR